MLRARPLPTGRVQRVRVMRVDGGGWCVCKACMAVGRPLLSTLPCARCGCPAPASPGHAGHRGRAHEDAREARCFLSICRQKCEQLPKISFSETASTTGASDARACRPCDACMCIPNRIRKKVKFRLIDDSHAVETLQSHREPHRPSFERRCCSRHSRVPCCDAPEGLAENINGSTAPPSRRGYR